MVSTKTIVVASAVTAAVAAVSYAAYFDYKRRNDRQFRRKLQRDRKKAEKAAGKSAKTASVDVEEQAIELLNQVAKEKLPVTAEEKEQFFMAQVSKGETLSAAGPGAYAEAACRFYQALKVYPNPIELVMIYQKTTPEPVFKLVMSMMAQEVRQKQARYFDVFPPKDKNVEIKDKNKEKKSKKGKKQEEASEDEVATANRGLFATKDFAAGEVIYEEESVISTLHPRAQNGQFCYHCLKAIPGATPRVKKAEPEAESVDETPVPFEESKIEEIIDEVKEVDEDTIEETAEEAIEEAIEEATEEVVEEAAEEAAEETTPEEVEAEGVALEILSLGSVESIVAVATPAPTPIVTAEPKVAEDAQEEEEEEKPTEEEVAEAKDIDTAFDCSKCHEAVYCSEKCRQDAFDAYHQFLCPSSGSPAAKEFAKFTRDIHELAGILVAKFFGTLVDREKKKELARTLGGAEDTEDEYTTWEHIERMRFLELIPTANDAQTLHKLGQLMSDSVPGLSEFVNEERFTMLKGKLDYNAYAVHAAEGVEVPAETEETHVSDSVRDDHSSEPVGMALYLISSHLAHDCDPNVQIVFPDSTDKAALKTLKPIAKGDELRVAYVDPALDKETRQKALKGTYRLDCTCHKCQSE